MIRTRDDILREIEYGVHNRPYVQRALIEGGVEFLGGFKQIPPWNSPGWIMKLTSKFKTVYLVAVISQQQEFIIMCRIIDVIPWHHWDGDKSSNPLYQGDRPEEYRRMKNEQDKK